MKYRSLILFLCLTGIVRAQDEQVLDSKPETIEEFELALASFEKGEAITGRQYFVGCLAGLILIENDLFLFEDLDDLDAPLADFTSASERGLSRIARTENALKMYESDTWAMRARMEVKTLNWLASVKGLFTDYLVQLSEPMSHPEATWTEVNHQTYERYIEAYDQYLLIDQSWVDFQYEFATANNFEIEGIVALNNYENKPTEADIKADARNLSNGDVEDAVRYFDGVLGYVLQIDAIFNGFITRDDEDAPLTQFNADINSCRALIFDLRKAMALYTEKNWAKQKEFDALTLRWVGIIEEIVNDYIVKLAEPMSRPDDTWSEKELKFYDKKYLSAFDRYLKVDLQWVNFQTVFAKANGFTLGPVIE